VAATSLACLIKNAMNERERERERDHGRRAAVLVGRSAPIGVSQPHTLDFQIRFRIINYKPSVEF